MELILIFLGLFITVITLKTVIEENIINKTYTKKTAKIIGFENFSYNSLDYVLNRGVLYPILEVEEKNKTIKLIMPIYRKTKKIREGEIIEIIYPKGKMEFSKIYKNEDNLKVHYLNMTCALMIIFISTIIF